MYYVAVVIKGYILEVAARTYLGRDVSNTESSDTKKRSPEHSDPK